MIVVSIDMWPGGDEEEKYPLGKVLIVNQANHHEHPRKSNYVAQFFDKNGRSFKSKTLDSWPRLAKSIWMMMEEVFKR